MVLRAPNTLTVIDKRTHGKKRRIISQGFSDVALKTHEDVILEQIQNLCMRLGEQADTHSWSSGKDMARLSDYFTFDVMSNIVFDEVLFGEAIQARDQFITFIDEMLQEGIKSSKGVFTMLTNAKDPETGQPLSMRELRGETATLIVAGTDTTSTALAVCFFYLSHNNKAYHRTAEEVRSMFHSADENRMGPQMNQCTALWREAEEGAVVDGKDIPQGVEVGTGIYSIHHNPAYYPQPFAFLPERWLPKEATNKAQAEDVLHLAHAAFNPFSIGTRSCIGKGLAYTELHLALAHILWSFDFRLAEGKATIPMTWVPGSQRAKKRPFSALLKKVSEQPSD
ncbi:hypothetical protein VTN77DRAFT_5396 [Rasamsonia byssochlamydoides]|uniref:uncharacterized protein n=1 Tax=Rasamsonia byssochlamydoides TaxID=89139 RepID=UPI00374494DD